jgi:hypothetical protein
MVSIHANARLCVRKATLKHYMKALLWLDCLWFFGCKQIPRKVWLCGISFSNTLKLGHITHNSLPLTVQCGQH